MSALPSLSATTLPLVLYLMTQNQLLAIGCWVFEVFISIPRDVLYTETAPVLTYETWLPTHRGVHLIPEVVIGRLIGLAAGLFMPFAYGHFLMPFILSVYVLIRDLAELGGAARPVSFLRFVFCWAVSTYLLHLDQLLMPSAVMLSIWSKADPDRYRRRRAPHPVSAALTSTMLSYFIGGSPGVNPSLVTVATEGGPAWLMGFIECFLEASVVGKAIFGISTSRGFMGLLELRLTFTAAFLVIVIGSLAGMAAMPLGHAITRSLSPHSVVIGWFFWAVILTIALSDLNPCGACIALGALLMLRASSGHLTRRSGLLVPIPFLI